MSNTKILIIALVVIAVALIAFGVYRMNVQAPVQPETGYELPKDDSPRRIEDDLNAIDTGANLDADFSTTDEDIKGF